MKLLFSLIFLINSIFIYAKDLKIYDREHIKYVHQKIEPKLSIDIPEFQREDVRKKMLLKYQESRKVLEESLADVVMEHQDVLHFVDEYLRRFFLIIKAHAEIEYQEKKDSGQFGPSEIFKDLYITLRENFHLSSVVGCIDYPEKSMLGAGFVGTNPLAIKKVQKEGNLREKIYQYYKGGRYIERLLDNLPLVTKINEYLQIKNAGFQIRIDLIPEGLTPYEVGAFSNIRIRDNVSFDDAVKWRNANLNIKMSESDKFFRIPLSEREKRIMKNLSRENDPNIIWIPGKAWFKPKNLSNCSDCPYAKEYLTSVDENYLEQYSSISSSADRMLTSAMYLDFASIADLYKARLVTLSMVDSIDHNTHEILFACKSFNLPFSFTADFYKEIYPLDSQFLFKLERAQNERGYEFPDYYLTPDYSLKILD